jgi:uncharacterized membrane protein
MTPDPLPDRYAARVAARRVAASAGAGLVAVAACAAVLPWQATVLVGWVAAAAAFLIVTWHALLDLDPEETAAHATRLDDSRLVADGVLLAASVASLIAVGLLLIKAAHEGGAAKAAFTAVSVASVVAAWAVVHTVFTLRYSHLYYGSSPPRPAIDFNGEDPPTYRDFAYVAFTVGMTYQVSDTNLRTPAMRSTALRHSMLSFVFGTVIIAMTINVVAGLLQ